MAELIDKGAFIEDIKAEIVNLAMDGLKGTPRDRSYLGEMIDRINEQPTTIEAEIRAKAIDEMVEGIREILKDNAIYNIDCITTLAEQLKGE